MGHLAPVSNASLVSGEVEGHVANLFTNFSLNYRREAAALAVGKGLV